MKMMKMMKMIKMEMMKMIKLSSDKSYILMKVRDVEIVKEVKRSDGL